MKILGITGSSGSGKTKVSEIFSKFDSTIVFNSDNFIKELDFPNSEYLADIKKEFGAEILLENGCLDRKQMANIIFDNKLLRLKLNKITKKYFVPKMLQIINENKNQKLIVFDIPILFENKLETYFDFILSVISDEKTQIERICLRDKITKEKAIKRLKNQYSNEFFIKNSDYVIYNFEKTEEELKNEVKEIFFKIIK